MAKKAERITKRIAHRVWKELDDGETPQGIEDAGITSERSASRLKTVKTGFENNDLPGEIALKAGWKNLNQVEKIKPWWEDYVRSRHLSEYRDHINELLDLAATIRNRIINPKVNQHDLINNTTWDYGGLNWRSTPSAWCLLVIPNLVAEKGWGELLPNLKSHLETRSNFWKQYDEFNNDVMALNKEFADIVEGAVLTDSKLYLNWVSFESKLTASLEQQPLDEKFSPDKFGDVDDENNLVSNMQKIFNNKIPELDKRYHKLETKLQGLWNELDKYKIKKIIESGRCPRCKYAGNAKE